MQRGVRPVGNMEVIADRHRVLPGIVEIPRSQAIRQQCRVVRLPGIRDPVVAVDLQPLRELHRVVIGLDEAAVPFGVLNRP